MIKSGSKSVRGWVNGLFECNLSEYLILQIVWFNCKYVQIYIDRWIDVRLIELIPLRWFEWWWWWWRWRWSIIVLFVLWSKNAADLLSCFLFVCLFVCFFCFVFLFVCRLIRFVALLAGWLAGWLATRRVFCRAHGGAPGRVGVRQCGVGLRESARVCSSGQRERPERTARRPILNRLQPSRPAQQASPPETPHGANLQ